MTKVWFITGSSERQAEFEKWMPVTLSTDHDEAVDFTQTTVGKMFSGSK